MDNSLISQFQKAMDEDQPGDGKSVFFTDGDVRVEEDLLDRNDSTGEYGFGALEEIIREGWSVCAPLSGELRVISDAEERYAARTSDRVLEVVLISFDEAKLAFDQEAGLTVLSSDDPYWLPQGMQQKYEKLALYLGLRELDSEVFAGYELLLEDYFGHAYRVGWLGRGNMTQIASEAFQLFQSFTVIFDLDQWLSEHE